MRISSSQLFAIALLSLLAALGFWLQSALQPPEVRNDGKLRHDPDSMAENFLVRQFDDKGLVKYRLTAPYMEHYPDDDSSRVDRPKLEYFRPQRPTLTLTADRAEVTSKGEKVDLEGNVRGVRAATAQRPEMIALTPSLTVLPNDGLAFTDSPVEIKEDKSWIKGVGMRLDNNLSTIELKSRVTGMSYPRRASK